MIERDSGFIDDTCEECGEKLYRVKVDTMTRCINIFGFVIGIGRREEYTNCPQCAGDSEQQERRAIFDAGMNCAAEECYRKHGDL